MAYRLEDLPPDVRARIEALPEGMQQAAVALYPDDERDRRAKAIRERQEARLVEERQAKRHDRVTQALVGDFGKNVKQAAEAVLKETGGAYTPTAVQRIIDVIRVASGKPQR